MLRWACAAALFALLCLQVVLRGPLTFRAPATILSNSLPPQKDSEPYLFFLRDIRSRVPRGATVAVLTPEGPNIGPIYLIAVGQLPEQNVWPVVTWGSRASPVHAEWVACFFTNLEDPLYRRVDLLPNGALFRRIR